MSAPLFPGLSVLIIDDIRASRALLRALLQSFGISEIMEAGDSVTALEILRTTHRDVVITDLLMHPMDGIEFTRTLRRPDGGINRYVPVLMVSGHTELQQVKNALAAGVTDFLAKPISPAALRLRLQTIVDKPKQRVAAASYCGPDRRRQAARNPNNRRQSDRS